MGNRINFFVVLSKKGNKRRFSINKKIFYCVFLLSLCLLCTGIIGAWKYRENISLEKKCLLLEAEKAQLEAVSRTVHDIKTEEKSLRKMMGLDGTAPKKQEE